jgi:hypothetical protein
LTKYYHFIPSIQFRLIWQLTIIKIHENVCYARTKPKSLIWLNSSKIYEDANNFYWRFFNFWATSILLKFLKCHFSSLNIWIDDEIRLFEKIQMTVNRFWKCVSQKVTNFAWICNLKSVSSMGIICWCLSDSILGPVSDDIFWYIIGLQVFHLIDTADGQNVFQLFRFYHDCFFEMLSKSWEEGCIQNWFKLFSKWTSKGLITKAEFNIKGK